MLISWKGRSQATEQEHRCSLPDPLEEQVEDAEPARPDHGPGPDDRHAELALARAHRDPLALELGGTVEAERRGRCVLADRQLRGHTIDCTRREVHEVLYIVFEAGRDSVFDSADVDLVEFLARAREWHHGGDVEEAVAARSGRSQLLAIAHVAADELDVAFDVGCGRRVQVVDGDAMVQLDEASHERDTDEARSACDDATQESGLRVLLRPVRPLLVPDAETERGVRGGERNPYICLMPRESRQRRSAVRLQPGCNSSLERLLEGLSMDGFREVLGERSGVVARRDADDEER